MTIVENNPSNVVINKLFRTLGNLGLHAEWPMGYMVWVEEVDGRVVMRWLED